MLFRRRRVLIEKLAVGIPFGDAAFLCGELEGVFAIEFSLVHELVDAGGEGLRSVRLGAGRSFFCGTNH